MSAPESRQSAMMAAAVLGLAGIAVALGLLAPRRAPALEPAVPASGESARPVVASAVDPQPEVHCQQVVFTITDPSTPEAISFLRRLGGADPTREGLFPADSTLDEQALQRAIRGVPGASVSGVMSVVAIGGQSAAISVGSETREAMTGVVVGRQQTHVMVTITVLADGSLAMSAEFREEEDPTALAVIGRRVGVPLGRTGEIADSLHLAAGQPAAIRLPGRSLRIVFLRVRVLPGEASPAPVGPGTPGPATPGNSRP